MPRKKSLKLKVEYPHGIYVCGRGIELYVIKLDETGMYSLVTDQAYDGFTPVLAWVRETEHIKFFKMLIKDFGALTPINSLIKLP